MRLLWILGDCAALCEKETLCSPSRIGTDKQIAAFQNSVYASYGSAWQNRLFVLGDFRIPILYKVRRSADVISRTLAERQDPRLIFSAELPLTLP